MRKHQMATVLARGARVLESWAVNTSARSTAAPGNTSPPAVSSARPKVGQNADCVQTAPGPVLPDGLLTYQWQRCTSANVIYHIASASSQSYKAVAADAGRMLRARSSPPRMPMGNRPQTRIRRMSSQPAARPRTRLGRQSPAAQSSVRSSPRRRVAGTAARRLTITSGSAATSWGRTASRSPGPRARPMGPVRGRLQHAPCARRGKERSGLGRRTFHGDRPRGAASARGHSRQQGSDDQVPVAAPDRDPGVRALHRVRRRGQGRLRDRA